MVDFKKLLNNRKHLLPAAGLPPRLPKENAPRVRVPGSGALRHGRDIGSDIDREMADPIYFDGLIAFIDTHSR